LLNFRTAGAKKVAYELVSVLNGLIIVVFIEKAFISINITCKTLLREFFVIVLSNIWIRFD